MLTSFALYGHKILYVFRFFFSSSIINASFINLLAEIIHSCESFHLMVRQMQVLFTGVVETIGISPNLWVRLLHECGST